MKLVPVAGDGQEAGFTQPLGDKIVQPSSSQSLSGHNDDRNSSQHRSGSQHGARSKTAASRTMSRQSVRERGPQPEESRSPFSVLFGSR